jgi:carboxypeptidase Q
MTRIRLLVPALAAIAAAPVIVQAQVVQEEVDLSVVDRIRDEGLNRSQLPEMARHLTDVIGPRLTGSPGMRTANDWTAEQFRRWGLAGVTVEPWGSFGRGWERVSYSGMILSPYVEPLHAQPNAWTGSTKGTVRGSAVIVRVDGVEDLERYRGTLEGKFVLVQDTVDVEPEFEPIERRFTSDELLEPWAPPEARGPGPNDQQRERFRRARELRQALAGFLLSEHAAAQLVPSGRIYGILRSGGQGPGRDPANENPTPQLEVAAAQYNHIYRNVAAGTDVVLEVNVQNRFFDDDLNAYNTLADLPGSDLADQYVMIGAHLDSWHMGSGATDNAAGSVVMMEAMRILKTLGLQPRRTIRIALWSGEEQGLLGSRNWVDNHPELHDKISAYLNVDNGTGKIRGIYSQMNEDAIPVFEQILWPFHDLGVVAVWNRNTGGTDHLSFDRAGIPGFNFVQDPIEYSIRTHHTDLDTFDYMLLDDLKQAAVVVAATAYHLAMRDEMMPRKEQPVP